MLNEPMGVWVTVWAYKTGLDAHMTLDTADNTWTLRIGFPTTSIFLSPDQVLELSDVLNGAVQQIHAKKESSDAE